METLNLNKVIANFHKYKDEKRLLEGFEDYKTYDILNPDTFLIFNFEKGTIKKAEREYDRDREYISEYYT